MDPCEYMTARERKDAFLGMARKSIAADRANGVDDADILQERIDMYAEEGLDWDDMEAEFDRQIAEEEAPVEVVHEEDNSASELISRMNDRD